MEQTARQSLLMHVPVSKEERDSLKALVNEICQRIKDRFKKLDKFESVLIRNSKFRSIDVEHDQIPEEFTKQHIIKPLLDFLGYDHTHQTRLRTQTSERQPDYIIYPKSSQDFKLYVEAEPMNVDLNAKGHGVNQIREWISVKNAVSDYGIATDVIRVLQEAVQTDYWGGNGILGDYLRIFPASNRRGVQSCPFNSLYSSGSC